MLSLDLWRAAHVIRALSEVGWVDEPTQADLAYLGQAVLEARKELAEYDRLKAELGALGQDN